MRARECAARYWSLGERIKALTDERDELKSALGIYIGENAILTASDGTKLASSSTQANPTSVDLKGIKKKEPEIFAHLVEGGYVKQSERRELRPAKIKEE